MVGDVLFFGGVIIFHDGFLHGGEVPTGAFCQEQRPEVTSGEWKMTKAEGAKKIAGGFYML